MNLAEKIVKHRKLNGWSQEELADKLNVSRQAVSKWESEQSMPELDNILQLAQLFDVTTDYLLKNDNCEYNSTAHVSKKTSVSEQDAKNYIADRRKAAGLTAFATFLCIMSVVQLILFTSLSALGTIKWSENTVVAVSLIIMFVMIAAAVGLFLYCGLKNAQYKFLESDYEADNAAKKYAEECKIEYRSTYTICNIIAVCLCVLSPIALFASMLTKNDAVMSVMLCITITIAAIGVALFTVSGVKFASMQKLLKEGDFSKKGKKQEAVDSAFWLIVTAIYLTWSFLNNAWHMTWIIWPIAGVIFGAIKAICNIFIKTDDMQ